MDPVQPARPPHRYRDFEPADISDPDVTVQLEVLCEACQHVGPWVLGNRRVEESQRQTLKHSKSGQALEKAYKDGCHLCTLLWHGLVEPSVQEFYSSPEKRLDDRNTRAGQVRGGSELQLILGPARYTWSPSDFSFSIKSCIKLVDGTDLDGVPHPLELGISLSRKSILNNHRLIAPSTTGISLSTHSESSLAQARTWLDECTRSHPRCQSQLSRTRPRRLLAVSRQPDGIHLQLKLSEELPDPTSLRWVCLSYCWGGSSTLKLTNSTTPTLQEGIMADRLPRTIQQAAAVVLALGLEFLWVDALCILQDSAEDWRQEAESMGDIYRGSFLTLAALGAADSSGGLFACRDPLVYSKCRVFLEDGEVATIYPAWSNFVPQQISNAYCWPLYTRGWVVQERILACRTLRFGPTLSWECWQSASSELDPSVERGLWDHYSEPLCSSFYQQVIDQGLSQDQSLSPAKGLEERVLDLWESIVGEFSKANLTVLSDRQAAILGLVSAIALRTGWKHLAGYWLPLSIQALLWKVTAHSHDTSRRTGLSPSWSWLSVTGGVHFVPCYPDDEYYAKIEGVDEEDGKVPMRLSCLRLRLGPFINGEYGAPDGWSSRNFSTRQDTPGGMPDDAYAVPLMLLDDPDTGFRAVEGITISPSRLCPGAYERVSSFNHQLWSVADKQEMLPAMEVLRCVRLRETVILV